MTDIAILGFGTIGSGVAEIILNSKPLSERFNIKYILDLREFPGHPLADRVVHDIDTIINDKDVKIVVEMMGGVHPAYDFTLKAIKAGKSAVTSNKAVVAAFGPELLNEAKNNGVHFLYEASVGGCIPIIRPLKEQVEVDEITSIYGIMNGTTNYILTQMKENGVSFETALKDAQKLGYAEADPTADVDGFDTCRKICILSAVAFGSLVPFENVKTVGIRNVTEKMIADAEKEGFSIKLIGRAEKTNDGVYISVEPMKVKKSSLLSNVDDVFNAILIKGKESGELMFYGKGAGKLPTANAVLTDICEIDSGYVKNVIFDRKPEMLSKNAPECDFAVSLF